MSDVDAPDIPHSHVPAGHPRRTKLKKLRFLMILVPLLVLALISTVFGMMMAVAHDLPSLEQLPQTNGNSNSVMVDIRGKPLGTLTSNEGRIIAKAGDIGSYVKYAVIATEDKRFYQNSGVDLKGIGRAFFQDVVSGGAVQGGSTITQQFVKVGLKAQDQRTVFNKLREAALAYHLTRKWSKEKILTEYLNSIYFGNGAYGIESAARTYFGQDPNHLHCGEPHYRPCAADLQPQEAALLAGIIASPSAYDPVAHPEAARRRRDVVLQKMLEQDRLTEDQYRTAILESIPGASQVQPPRSDSRDPYFTSWVRQSLVDKVGARQAFEGGLKIKTTIDLDFEQAARTAIDANVNKFGGPTAALVAIDNKTGEVRAMYGGRDYSATPFNLATQGQRQPGSSFKPFILAAALRDGISPGSVWPSMKRVFNVPGTHGREKFEVNNFDDAYAGQSSLANALTNSDNSVFAAVGIKVGTANVAKLAQEFGIRTPVSHNLAMTLGALEQGVTPLDMAHAYETFAAGGNRISGSLGASDEGPVGIRRITYADGRVKENKKVVTQVVSAKLARLESQMLTGPVRYGTAKRAQIPGMVISGKTGTTENNGDAWFVGFNERYTVAVWVGYPDSVKSMSTDFAGDEVTGGTFPALIWRQFMLEVQKIDKQREVARENARLARENAKRLREGKQPLTPTTPGLTTDSTGTTTQSATGNQTTQAPATTTPVTSDDTGGVGAAP